MPSQTRELSLDALAVQSSPYLDLRSKLRAPDSPALSASMEALGQLSPLIVRERVDGLCFDVVDGFRRAAAAEALGWSSIDCRVMERSAPASSVLEVALVCRLDELGDNLVAKVRLVRLARRLGMSAESVTERLLPPMGLQGHVQVLKRCEAIGQLPETVLDFCEAKSFSMKQCVHLTRHPREVLDLVFSWSTELNLTASIAEELASNISDLVRLHGGPVGDFSQRRDVRLILDGAGSVQQTTRDLRDLLARLRMPTLAEVNRRMQTIRQGLALPDAVGVTWDPSLEHRELRVDVTLRDPDEWPGVLKVLSQAKFADGVAGILEEL